MLKKKLDLKQASKKNMETSKKLIKFHNFKL